MKKARFHLAKWCRFREFEPKRLNGFKEYLTLPGFFLRGRNRLLPTTRIIRNRFGLDRSVRINGLTNKIYAAHNLVHHRRFHRGFDRARHHAGRAAPRFHNDHATWYCRLGCRRPDRPLVFQTGTGFVVSSSRLHHVAYRRDHSALYLDKAGGLRRAFAPDFVVGERGTVPLHPLFDVPVQFGFALVIRPKSNC